MAGNQKVVSTPRKWSGVLLVMVLALLLAASPTVGRIVKILPQDFRGHVAYNDYHLNLVPDFWTGYWLWRRRVGPL